MRQLSLKPQMIGMYGGNRVWIEGVADLFGGLEMRSKLSTAKLKTKWRRGTKKNPELSFVSDGQIFMSSIKYFSFGDILTMIEKAKYNLIQVNQVHLWIL